MDYRRPLFRIEQWSPKLARKIWGLSPLFLTPSALLFGLKLKTLNDTSVEVEIPNRRSNRNEFNQIQNAAFMIGAELATRVLWDRHIAVDMERPFLKSIQIEFIKPASSSASGKAELKEAEREKTLREIRQGHIGENEISVVFTDEQGQQLSTVNCLWQFKPLRLLALEKTSGG